MSRARPTVCIFTDQLLNNSVHLKNDAFKHISTRCRENPMIAVGVESRQTQQEHRHAIFEVMSQPPSVSKTATLIG